MQRSKSSNIDIVPPKVLVKPLMSEIHRLAPALWVILFLQSLLTRQLQVIRQSDNFSCGWHSSVYYFYWINPNIICIDEFFPEMKNISCKAKEGMWGLFLLQLATPNHIQNPVKHLKWSFFAKIVNDWKWEKLHLRCWTGFLSVSDYDFIFYVFVDATGIIRAVCYHKWLCY